MRSMVLSGIGLCELPNSVLTSMEMGMINPVASAGTLGAGAAGPQGFQLIWPTVQDIRDSVEGWRGGASVPGPSKNVNKPFLQPYWHRCSARSHTKNQ